MLAKKYLSELVSIKSPIKGIYTLEFKSLGKRYKYSPGQFLHLAMDENYDGIGQWPDSRCFSMQSNSTEQTLKITYAVKGEFTCQMEQELKVGKEIWLKLPYGDLFTQMHNKNNTVFIAGGTGITPFLSLFGHQSFNEYTTPRIYIGFRSKTFNIYQDKLSNLLNKDANLKLYYKNIDGILNIEKIFEENGSNANYFISGPPLMIKNFKQVLIKKHTPAANILTDDWE